MERTIYLGGQKIKTVELISYDWFNRRVTIEHRPWYEGRSRRFGKHTKRYADGRQKLRRRRVRKSLSNWRRW